MLAIIGGSLLVSATATANDPASAYFVTQTRVWELALGGFVATLAPAALAACARRRSATASPGWASR